MTNHMAMYSQRRFPGEVVTSKKERNQHGEKTRLLIISTAKNADMTLASRQWCTKHTLILLGNMLLAS